MSTIACTLLFCLLSKTNTHAIKATYIRQLYIKNITLYGFSGIISAWIFSSRFLSFFFLQVLSVFYISSGRWGIKIKKKLNRLMEKEIKIFHWGVNFYFFLWTVFFYFYILLPDERRRLIAPRSWIVSQNIYTNSHGNWKKKIKVTSAEKCRARVFSDRFVP